MASPEYSAVGTGSGGGIPMAVKVGAPIACVGLAGFGIWMGLVQYITGMAIDGFITLNDDYVDETCRTKNLKMANITNNIYWVGCGMVSKMSDFKEEGDGDGKCVKGGCVTFDKMEEMDTFNDKNPGKLVSYPSRAGKVDGKDLEVVQLKGWWLPAPNDKGDAPRIVVQHGFTSNGNKYRQEYVAYLLRSLGFSVLVNNLRDHCYSDDSKARVVEWGHAYPYDLLGAWDYAQKAGGNEIDASKVGVLGFSMGGFITQNAFGLESNIPAAWVDGALWTPFNAFELGITNTLGGMGIGFLLNLPLADAVWSNVQSAAKAKGVDIHAHLPENVLTKGSDTARPVFVTANKNDATVPYASSESLVALLKKNPKKYALDEFWSHEAGCKAADKLESHCIDHVREPSQYKAKLCKFWTKVFGLSSDFCSGSKESMEEEESSKTEEESSKEEASRRLNLI